MPDPDLWPLVLENARPARLVRALDAAFEIRLSPRRPVYDPERAHRGRRSGDANHRLPSRTRAADVRLAPRLLLGRRAFRAGERAGAHGLSHGHPARELRAPRGRADG